MSSPAELQRGVYRVHGWLTDVVTALKGTILRFHGTHSSHSILYPVIAVVRPHPTLKDKWGSPVEEILAELGYNEYFILFRLRTSYAQRLLAGEKVSVNIGKGVFQEKAVSEIMELVKDQPERSFMWRAGEDESMYYLTDEELQALGPRLQEIFKAEGSVAG